MPILQEKGYDNLLFQEDLAPTPLPQESGRLFKLQVS
jgi:hypothetical protein